MCIYLNSETNVELFLEMQGKHDFMIHFIDECWIQKTAYLSDIFSQLSKLNMKLQGKNLHISIFEIISRLLFPNLRTGDVKQILETLLCLNTYHGK